MRITRLRILLLALVWTGTSAELRAQFLNAFEFSFSNPGARSLGFGGAFAPMADDATAAFANPAGLVQLLRPEVSIEGRLWSFSTSYIRQGRISGLPSGVGLDTSPGLNAATASDRLTDLSFLSFVYPGSKWAVAIYWHKLANFEFSSETQGIFADPTTLRFSGRTGLQAAGIPRLDFRTFTRLEVNNYGISGAFQIAENVNLGAGLVVADGKLTSSTEVYPPVGLSLPGGFYGENTYPPGGRALTSGGGFDGIGVTFTAGLLWMVSPDFRFGAFYRGAPEFDIESQDISGPAEPRVPVGTTLFSVTSPIRLPEVWGLGLSYRSGSGALTMSFEWDRVQYSTLLDSLSSEFFGPQTRRADLKLEDANELHAGVEYAFLGASPVVALRVGFWSDPAHRISYVGADPLLGALLPPGDDQLHVAAGAGLAFKRFQIDAAASFSGAVDTLSVSTIFGF